MVWNLRSYPTTVVNERMWHLGGGDQGILWPLVRIFRGKDPLSPRVRPPPTVQQAVYLCRCRTRCCNTVRPSTSDRDTRRRRTSAAALCNCGSAFCVLEVLSTERQSRRRQETTSSSHRQLQTGQSTFGVFTALARPGEFLMIRWWYDIIWKCFRRVLGFFYDLFSSVLLEISRF